MPNAKSLACGFAFTQRLGFYAADFYVVQQEGNKHFLLFCIASWRTINHIVQKATTTSVFLCCIARSNGNEIYRLCHIARSDDIKYVCFVVLGGHK